MNRRLSSMRVLVAATGLIVENAPPTPSGLASSRPAIFSLAAHRRRYDAAGADVQGDYRMAALSFLGRGPRVQGVRRPAARRAFGELKAVRAIRAAVSENRWPIA